MTEKLNQYSNVHNKISSLISTLDIINRDLAQNKLDLTEEKKAELCNIFDNSLNSIKKVRGNSPVQSGSSIKGRFVITDWEDLKSKIYGTINKEGNGKKGPRFDFKNVLDKAKNKQPMENKSNISNQNSNTNLNNPKKSINVLETQEKENKKSSESQKDLDLKHLDLISNEKINEVKKIGEGGFGQVWIGKLNKHSNVAIKKVISKLTDEQREKLIKEVSLMNKVKHPKLIHFYGYYKDSVGSLCFIMEHCNGGDLMKVLQNEKYKLSMKQRFEILIDIAHGIHHFHTQTPPMIHRDIKSSNVLITNLIENENSYFKAKLSDYGEAKIWDEMSKNAVKQERGIENGLYTNYNGTVQYAPLEVLEGNLDKLSTKSDVYSFGTVIWEMFTERVPYEEQRVDGFELALRIITNKIKPKFDWFIKDTPNEIKQLILNCWQDEPENRPIIDEVLSELEKIQKENNFVDEHSSIHNKIEKKCFLPDEKKSLYVPPKGGLFETAEETFDLLDYMINNFINNKNKKVLLLLGSSGSGKSLFTKFLQDNLLADYKNILPFRVDLNTIKNPAKNLIPEILEKYGIDQNERVTLHKEKLLFILDGFDEILGEDNLYLMNKFDQFQNVKIIISCRDEYLLNKNVKENFSKIFYPDERGKEFIQVFLRNFEMEEIKQFIINFLNQNKSNKKFEEWTIEKYYRIFELLIKTLPMIKTPFLLNLICEIIPTNELFKNEDNLKELKRITIYEIFLNLLYLHEYNRQMNINNKIRFSHILEHQKIQEMLEYSQELACALFMINYRFENYIPEQENKETFNNNNYNNQHQNNLNNNRNDNYDNNVNDENDYNNYNNYNENNSYNNYDYNNQQYYADDNYNHRDDNYNRNENNDSYYSGDNTNGNFDNYTTNNNYESMEDSKNDKKNENSQKKEGKLIYNYIYKDMINQNVFRKFFKEDDKSKFFFKVTPLREVEEGKWTFTHKSIMEYFVSLKIINEIQNFRREFLEDRIILDKFVVNTTKLQENPSIVSFIAEYLNINPKFVKKLWKCVYLTKKSIDIDLLSSNCMTILNFGMITLSEKDFSGLRFPFADLREAYLTQSNFTNCNLSYCNFSQSNLDNCNFSNANMDNVILGEKDPIEFNEKIMCIEYSKDGKYLAVGLEDKCCIIKENGKKIILDREFDVPVFEIHFSPDNQYLACCGMYDVKIFDIKRGFEFINNIPSGGKFLTTFCFSNDGNYLTLKTTEMTFFYDVREDFSFLKVLEDEDEDNNQYICFSPDDRYYVCQKRKEIIFYDFNNDLEIFKRIPEDLDISSMRFSPDAKYLCYIIRNQDIDNKIKILDLEDNFKLIKQFDDYNKFKSISFSADNKYFSVIYELYVIFYDVSQMFKEVKNLQKKTSMIAFCNRNMALVNNKNQIIIYDISEGFNQIKGQPDHEMKIWSLTYDKNDSIIVAGPEIIYSFDKKNEYNLKKFYFDFNENEISRVSYSPEGNYLYLFMRNNEIYILDSVNDFKILSSKKLLDGDIVDSLFSENGGYFAISQSNSIKIYNIYEDFSLIKNLNLDSYPSKIIFSSLGKYFAYNIGNLVHIHDEDSGFSHYVEVNTYYNEKVGLGNFSIEDCYGYLAAADYAVGALLIYNFSKKQVKSLNKPIHDHKLQINCITFHSLSYLVTAGLDKIINFYNCEKKFEKLFTLSNGNVFINEIFSRINTLTIFDQKCIKFYEISKNGKEWKLIMRTNNICYEYSAINANFSGVRRFEYK